MTSGTSRKNGFTPVGKKKIKGTSKSDHYLICQICFVYGFELHISSFVRKRTIVLTALYSDIALVAPKRRPTVSDIVIWHTLICAVTNHDHCMINVHGIVFAILATIVN